MLKLISALVATATLATAAPSFADGIRRDRVETRLARQDHRIAVARREHEITRAQAFRLHRADARIARVEHRDLRRNGGYLGRGQARRLEHRENRVSRQIYRARR